MVLPARGPQALTLLTPLTDLSPPALAPRATGRGGARAPPPTTPSTPPVSLPGADGPLHAHTASGGCSPRIQATWVSKERGTPMGMGAGLQPPRLGRPHLSGELPRPSEGPQSPQNGAWGTCPRPPRPRSCAGPERLPRGHISSPRPAAAGVGGQPGPQTQPGLA